MFNNEIRKEFKELSLMTATALQGIQTRFIIQDEAFELLYEKLERLEKHIELQEVKLQAYINLEKEV